ncbi:MAG: alpha/beta fold hydrolase [Xanthomonadales bacterium]|nr:alpha/beta hydrolase [Gammaproteobacteria bacterium]MBT8054341.1 alpha/beta hydrolase [Gammaproteobacteria bacterium]NND57466.1 alpha/beta fold hydrolase [Xanthomonadales bacterium]NNK51190.1 alpha/beta fold hydrolase [Xanthomonadales bacterium]
MFFRQLSVAALFGASLIPTAPDALGQPAGNEPGIEMESCELVVPGTPLSVAGQCGWMDVAENPDDPDGRRIGIHVARIPARGRETEPDPLVFFAGGPGQSATESWPILAGALNKVSENRDILLVDQRGTGQSNPLKCPQIELDEALALDWDELGRTTRECLDSLDGDPRYYTTTIAMHDIDAARAALGYEQVNLYGGSYGTRAAQVYLRLFPERVRSAVLDGVVPQTLALGTEHAEKLDQTIYRVLRNCDDDALCSNAFPDTAGKLSRLIQKLEQDPVTVTVEHPTTGQPFTLPFNREVLSTSLRFLTYSADTQAMLPLLINEAAESQRFDRLASQMLIAATGLQQSISQGMELSVMCAEDFPLFPKTPGTDGYLMGDMMHRAVGIQCGIWPRGRVPINFHEPVTGDLPVLLLSGELDPVTPPEYADQVAVNFPDSRHLIAPGQGHIATTRGCMGKIVSEFIIEGSADDLETDCISNMQATPFFISLTGPTP